MAIPANLGHVAAPRLSSLSVLQTHWAIYLAEERVAKMDLLMAQPVELGSGSMSLLVLETH